MSDFLCEPLRGAIGDLRPYQLSGLEAMRGLVRGQFPGPPVSRLVGLRPVEAALGKATFSMPVTRWLEDATGLYWGGVSALFADAPLACALLTTLPRGKGVTTSELSLNYVRPVDRSTGSLVGRAECIHSGAKVGLSHIQITDQDGRMVAQGSTRCLVIDVPADPEAEYPAPDTGPDDPPDPYLREVPAEAYFDETISLVRPPMEVFEWAQSSGHRSPFWRLSGFRMVSMEDGRTVGTLPSSPWLSNGGPAVYGGLLAWVAEITMGFATYSTVKPGDAFAALDLSIRFTRPALVGSGDFTLAAEVKHRGRRLRVSSCRIDNAEGKCVALATSSAFIVEGGLHQVYGGRLPTEILADIEAGR